MDRRLSGLIALATVLALSSCGGCYYARLGYGQARILLGRRPLERVLEDPEALSLEEKAKLALVPELRAFAQRRLGLAKNGSYTTFYDSGARAISWNITACEATSFRPVEWSFPFVGSASYKGFFEKDEAEAEAARLRERGLDVVVREVTAYSTLGWFDDPVFRGMLSRTVHDLANTIIHELTHATVFRPGNQAFNESVATFVGDHGTLAFLAAHFGPGSRELKAARDAAHDDAIFTAFMNGLYERLDRLYGSDAPDDEKRARRDEIFAEARADFETVRRERMRDPGAWARFSKRPLNNAVILGYRSYHTDLEVLDDVLALCGGDFRAVIRVLSEAAAQDEDAPLAFLAGWCAIARARTSTKLVLKPS